MMLLFAVILLYFLVLTVPTLDHQPLPPRKPISTQTSNHRPPSNTIFKMKFTAISILALAALASGSPTSRTYPQCNPWNPAARDDLIKSCVDELNAHGEDILTIEGVPSHPYFTTAYENVCARECDDPSAVTKCAQSVVSIQLYTVGIFNTTKRDVACGVQTILDACITPAVDPSITWKLVSGFGLACGSRDISIDVSGCFNGM